MTYFASLSLTIKSNTLRAEDLEIFRQIICPKNSPIPEAVKAIKRLANENKLWSGHPIMRVIENTTYEIKHSSETYSSSDDWKVTLANEVILLKKDGTVIQSRIIHLDSNFCVIV